MDTIKNIMLVDDDRINNFVTKKIIQQANYNGQINILYNATDALEQIKECCLSQDGDKNLVLLDLNMPGLNGFDFLDELSRLKRDKGLSRLALSVVVFTSSTNPDDMDRARKYPIAGYIDKPMTQDKVKKIFTLASSLNGF